MSLLLLSLLWGEGLPGSRADAASTQTSVLWGIAESGLELGRGDRPGTDYAVPDASYFLDHHVTLIRLPFRMERLQPQPMQELDPAFLQRIKDIVHQNAAKGALTVLDPHGYGFYDIAGKPQDLLENPVAAADYVDLMRRLAVAFAHEKVAIGLMNEPHTGSDKAYAVLWNRAILAMRQAGFRGTILVPHAHWGNAKDISPEHPYEGQIQDPMHNWVLELHLYLDPDSTGLYRQPVARETIGRERLAGAIDWSRQSKIRLFLGEVGGPPDARSLAALRAVFTDVATNPDVFWGISLWGAGKWWKPTYPMRLDPIDGKEQPQFRALEASFNR